MDRADAHACPQDPSPAPGSGCRAGGYRGALGRGGECPETALPCRWTGLATCCRRSMALRTRTTRRPRCVLAAPRAGQASVPPALRWLLGGGDLPGPPSWPGPCRAFPWRPQDPGSIAFPSFLSYQSLWDVLSFFQQMCCLLPITGLRLSGQPGTPGRLLPPDLAQVALAFPPSQQRLSSGCDIREGSLAAHRAWVWGHRPPQLWGTGDLSPLCLGGGWGDALLLDDLPLPPGASLGPRSPRGGRSPASDLWPREPLTQGASCPRSPRTRRTATIATSAWCACLTSGTR